LNVVYALEDWQQVYGEETVAVNEEGCAYVLPHSTGEPAGLSPRLLTNSQADAEATTGARASWVRTCGVYARSRDLQEGTSQGPAMSLPGEALPGNTTRTLAMKYSYLGSCPLAASFLYT
jgi:hypothetical protein